MIHDAFAPREICLQVILADDEGRGAELRVHVKDERHGHSPFLDRRDAGGG